MGSYKEVSRCKECGKIYDRGVPKICMKCGTQLGSTAALSWLLGNGLIVTDPNKVKKVIARRRLFRWQIRRPEQTATQGNQVSGNDLQQDTEGTV